jgi:hypothetical protein
MRIAQSQTRRPGTAAVAETPCRCAQPPQRGQTQDPAHAVVSLHGAIGNQAVQRLLRSGAIQAKLAVSQPDDPYEREADRVADQVLQMPEPAVEGTPVQGHGQTSQIQRKCGPCQEEETVQRKETPAAAVASTPPVGSSAFSPRGAGHALPGSVRDFFEPRLGHDFSQVRVHTDSEAAESARAVNALAYTVGRDVVFGAGQYAPQTSRGRHVLAHELTHVIQQTGVPGSLPAACAVIQRQQGPATDDIGSPTQDAEELGDCSGWERDTESFTIVAAEHFVLTELDPSLLGEVEAVECQGPAWWCWVTYSTGLRVDVRVFTDRRVGISAGPKYPSCHYTYDCIPDEYGVLRLVLTKDHCILPWPGSAP